MTQFEKDLAYVKKRLTQVITPDDLSSAKRLKRDFNDKYIVLVSQTDMTFINIMAELDNMEMEATRKITSAYLFR